MNKKVDELVERVRLTPEEFMDCAKNIPYTTDVEKAGWAWIFGARLIEKQCNKVLQAFNQWLEEQGTTYKVKCPHCSWSQFTDGEAVAMSPCYECNSTGYIFEPLRLGIDV